MSELLPHHREWLEVISGLSPEVVAARGYYSVESRDQLRGLGLPRDIGRYLPGLGIPVFAVRHLEPGEAFDPTGLILRPDVVYQFKDGRTAKYLSPAKQAPGLDINPLAREWLFDAMVPLVLTEGILKADSAVSTSLAAIGLGGVDGGWCRGAPLPEWELVPLKGRQALIAFDSDVTVKKSVRGALQRLAGYLQRRGAQVEIVMLPPGPHGVKVGLDGSSSRTAAPRIRSGFCSSTRRSRRTFPRKVPIRCLSCRRTSPAPTWSMASATS